MLLNSSTFGVRGIEVSWARPLFIVKLYLGFVTAIQQHVYSCVQVHSCIQRSRCTAQDCKLSKSNCWKTANCYVSKQLGQIKHLAVVLSSFK